MIASLEIYDVWEMASRNYIQVASNKYKSEINQGCDNKAFH